MAIEKINPIMHIVYSSLLGVLITIGGVVINKLNDLEKVQIRIEAQNQARDANIGNVTVTAGLAEKRSKKNESRLYYVEAILTDKFKIKFAPVPDN